ncbi:hypothetical protein SAY87_025932 [Trapa incisa]|uniref:Uncharacterized protein n=1 Tax=Trapa incisa TaxID=236973 RepID=A0AAN7GST8_9MYRT|nr:hypothetical protein SAY87_025932 [Trapa incisa]
MAKSSTTCENFLQMLLFRSGGQVSLTGFIGVCFNVAIPAGHAVPVHHRPPGHRLGQWDPAIWEELPRVWAR